MTAVDLGRADIALFADPLGTRVVIPALTSASRTRARAGTLVQFEGDEYPTMYRGGSRTGTFDLTCRFTSEQHPDKLALLLLIDEVAPSSPDARLLLRTHVGLAPGLNPAVAVAVFEVRETPVEAGVADVQFTAQIVQHTFEV